jgi:hypothetical protein
MVRFFILIIEVEAKHWKCIFVRLSNEAKKLLIYIVASYGDFQIKVFFSNFQVPNDHLYLFLIYFIQKLIWK